VKPGEIMTLQGSTLTAVVFVRGRTRQRRSHYASRHSCDERYRSRHRHGHFAQELAITGGCRLIVAYR
jgi:hypothetical protein